MFWIYPDDLKVTRGHKPANACMTIIGLFTRPSKLTIYLVREELY